MVSNCGRDTMTLLMCRMTEGNGMGRSFIPRVKTHVKNIWVQERVDKAGS